MPWKKVSEVADYSGCVPTGRFDTPVAARVYCQYIFCSVALLYFTYYCAVPSPGTSRCCRCCRSAIVKRFDPKRDGTPLKSLSLWLLFVLVSKYILKSNAEQQWHHSQNSSTLWQQLIIIIEGKKGQQKQCNWYDVKISSWLRYSHSLAKSPSHTSYFSQYFRPN